MKNKLISIICATMIVSCLFLIICIVRNKMISPMVIANVEALGDYEYPHQNNQGTCGYGGIDYDMWLISECSLPQSVAIEWYNNNRGKYGCMGWCCESCSQTWYCGNGEIVTNCN